MEANRQIVDVVRDRLVESASPCSLRAMVM